jgi:hypothetical protein
MDFYRRHRSVLVVPDSWRTDFELHSLSREPHSIRRIIERRAAAHGFPERLKRQQLFFGDCIAAALPGFRQHPNHWGDYPKHSGGTVSGGHREPQRPASFHQGHGQRKFSTQLCDLGVRQHSNGKVTTKVAQTVSFYNHQYFSITGNRYLQDISQGTTVNSYTTVSQPGAANIIYNQNYIFPLTVDISLAFLTNGNINQTTNANRYTSRLQEPPRQAK